MEVNDEVSPSFTPSMFLSDLCEDQSQSSSASNKKSYALTFGWLFEVCLRSDIPFSSAFVTFLTELQDTYKPLKVNLAFRVKFQNLTTINLILRLCTFLDG